MWLFMAVANDHCGDASHCHGREWMDSGKHSLGDEHVWGGKSFGCAFCGAALILVHLVWHAQVSAAHARSGSALDAKHALQQQLEEATQAKAKAEAAATSAMSETGGWGMAWHCL